MYLNEKKKLLISEYLRIIIAVLILLLLKIPLFIKIILIIICEKIDCSPNTIPYTGPLFSQDITICKSDDYQKFDKIADSIIYIFLLLYILSEEKLGSKINYILSILLLYRLLGTYLFIKTNNRKYLLYFPNFFLEISLFILIFQYYPFLKKNYLIIFIILIIFKIIQEYYLHFHI